MAYTDHVGATVIIRTTYGMVYSGVEVVAADDTSVMVRVDTKSDSKHYDIAAERIACLTVLGPAITTR